MTEIEKKILSLFKKRTPLSSGDLYKVLAVENVSQVTIKRYLTDLVNEGYLGREGGGRSVRYILTPKGFLLKPFDPDTYLNLPELERGSEIRFSFDLFTLLGVPLFNVEEMAQLDAVTALFARNKREGSETIHKKELERFIIELSWKSSKIEGNTYTLLDTELLLKEGLKSNKHTESETQMILNHKKAFEYIFSNQKHFEQLSIKKIEEVHYLLTEELGIKRNLRKSPVGVTGTIYKPLDNEFQIREALENAVNSLNAIENPFQKALLTILCIGYIQPFEDGNKRTSRLLGNAVLLAQGLAPLSYRNVDEAHYRGASLVFYEQNSIEPFKKIFIEQYIFSCNTYNLG